MFLSTYASKQPKLKLLRGYETNDQWYQIDGIHLKTDQGIKYATALLTATRRCVDRGGVVSLSSSMENDLRYTE